MEKEEKKRKRKRKKEQNKAINRVKLRSDHRLFSNFLKRLVLTFFSILPSSIFKMATTNELPAVDVNSYDYIVVGGGTAGCVIAARLAEYLPNKRTLVIEGGPSDFMDDRVLNLKEWLNLLGGELDYDYGTTEQPMGKIGTPGACQLR
jgi:hypothetical protein